MTVRKLQDKVVDKRGTLFSPSLVAYLLTVKSLICTTIMYSGTISFPWRLLKPPNTYISFRSDSFYTIGIAFTQRFIRML